MIPILVLTVLSLLPCDKRVVHADYPTTMGPCLDTISERVMAAQSIRPSFRVDQTPALKPDAKPPVAASVPALAEVTTLRLEKIQLQAAVAQKDLENSDAARQYRAVMDTLGQQMKAIIADIEVKYPGFTLDTVTLKLVPKKKDDGK